MTILKRYLRINSLFSAFSGLLMLLCSTSLNDLFHIQNGYVFPLIGANLLAFAAFVGYVSSKQLTNKTLISIISILDLLWVFGSFVIVLFNLFDLSRIGNMLIIAVAIWIGFLAYKQFKHNK
jgi:hypothetical protein